MFDQEVAKHFLDAVNAGNLSRILELLQVHPEIDNPRDERGRSALHLVAAAKHVNKRDLVELLLTKGTDINTRDDDGRTPLHYLVAAGDITNVRLFLDRGADVNVRDRRGVAPLHCAALLASSFADLLLDYGADIEVTDARGEAPIMWALRDGNLTTARRLWDRGAARDALRAAGLGEVEHLSKILNDQSGVVRAQDVRGNSPLHWAAWNGQFKAVEFLLESGQSVDDRNDKGETPLHIAAFRYAQLDVLRALLDRGACVDARDAKGRTPLHKAAQKADPDKVGLLMERGARVDAIDTAGQTPLDLLMSSISDEVTFNSWIVKHIEKIRSFLCAGGYEVLLLLTSRKG